MMMGMRDQGFGKNHKKAQNPGTQFFQAKFYGMTI